MWTWSRCGRESHGRSSNGSSSSLSLGSRPYRLYGERDGVDGTGVSEEEYVELSVDVGERYTVRDGLGGVEESEVSELERDMVRCG